MGGNAKKTKRINFKKLNYKWAKVPINLQEITRSEEIKGKVFE